MSFKIIRNDITKVKVDAIVNAAKPSLEGGGGVDGAIHRAAGHKLLAECKTLGGCHTGQAKITRGYDLPAKYVIHTVGPVWNGGNDNERDLLKNCYKNSLKLAVENNCESIAFPLISSGVYGYPKDKAVEVATEAIAEFLEKNEMEIYLVVYDRKAVKISEKLFSEIENYIDDKYVEDRKPLFGRSNRGDASIARNIMAPLRSPRKLSDADENLDADESLAAPDYHDAEEAIEVSAAPSFEPKMKSIGLPETMPGAYATSGTLQDAIDSIDESFSEMLLRKIDESGMKDSECYKKANIDRKLFSKIRSDIHYRPSKQTALAFAIALEMSLDETKDFLMKAGYALSHSNKFDIIIEFFITKGNFDIYEINTALFKFDQPLLA